MKYGYISRGLKFQSDKITSQKLNFKVVKYFLKLLSPILPRTRLIAPRLSKVREKQFQRKSLKIDGA